ncbi:hypothetical protein GCM10023091_08390 [Ravibacter arvi]|uniref:Uncharacterized protein n=1 Tax=Ravibacter arvi TaxID=2051041 RepID=A0ABP8LRK2_9BACT
MFKYRQHFFNDRLKGARAFELPMDCVDNGYKDGIPKGSDLFYGRPISLEQLEAEFESRKQPLYALACTHGIYVVVLRKVERKD